MQKLAWTLVPVALVAGAVGGYLGRGTQTKTQTVVQVQTRTVSTPPRASHVLTAEIRGPDGGCLTSDFNYPSIARHTFSLRRPGNGNSLGAVVAVAEREGTAACNLDVQFKISPNLGFFMVSDENADGTIPQWGPFDSRQMASQGWAIHLNEN